MANKDKDQDTRQPTKKGPADSEKRAEDLKPPKEKGKAYAPFEARPISEKPGTPGFRSRVDETADAMDKRYKLTEKGWQEGSGYD